MGESSTERTVVTIRQLTGKPRVYRAYARFDGSAHWCGHNHRGVRTAQACARQIARDMDALIGWERRGGEGSMTKETD